MRIDLKKFWKSIYAITLVILQGKVIFIRIHAYIHNCTKHSSRHIVSNLTLNNPRPSIPWKQVDLIFPLILVHLWLTLGNKCCSWISQTILHRHCSYTFMWLLMVILVLENYRVTQDHLKTASAIGASCWNIVFIIKGFVIIIIID